MKYNLVASDFDDTLYPFKTRKISEYTIKTIAEFKARGGIFVIVTGRMYPSIIKQTQKLGLSGILVSYQGALISDIESGKTIKSTPIEHSLAVEYLKFAKHYPLNAVQVYMDNMLFIEQKNKYTDWYTEYCGVTAVETGDMVSFVENNLQKVLHKVYLATDEDVAAELRAAARKNFEGKLLINSSSQKNVEAVNFATSKGKALLWLCKKYGIKAENAIGFGDQLNDITLIESAGLGVAVGNATEELKKVADYVCEPCDEDGLAKTIRKYCFEEKI